MHCCYRYFSEVELRELFSLEASRLSYSHTAQELHKHHATDRAYDADMTAHVASLTEHQFAVDTSDHSVLFSRVDESASGAFVCTFVLPLDRLSHHCCERA